MMVEYEAEIVAVYAEAFRAVAGGVSFIVPDDDCRSSGLRVGDWVRFFGGPGETLLSRLRRERPEDDLVVVYDALRSSGHATATDTLILLGGPEITRRTEAGSWQEIDPLDGIEDQMGLAEISKTDGSVRRRRAAVKKLRDQALHPAAPRTVGGPLAPVPANAQTTATPRSMSPAAPRWWPDGAAATAGPCLPPPSRRCTPSSG